VHEVFAHLTGKMLHTIAPAQTREGMSERTDIMEIKTSHDFCV
jgi:hypothetical protein